MPPSFALHFVFTFSCAFRINSASFRRVAFGSATTATGAAWLLRCPLVAPTGGRSACDDDDDFEDELPLDLILLCLAPRALDGAARRESEGDIERGGACG